MKTYLCISVLIATTLATGGARGDIVDQSLPDPPYPVTSGFQFGINLDNAVYAHQFANIGQTFTPTLTSLNFFTLYLEDSNPGNSLGGSFYMQILGFDGTDYTKILGTSATLTVPDSLGSPPPGGFNNIDGAPAQFLFATPVALAPGTMYEGEIFKTSGDSFLAVGDASSNSYAGGSYTGGGGGDFYFAEGITTQSVPEPSSIALLGVAGVIFIMSYAFKQLFRTRSWLGLSIRSGAA